MKEHSFDLVKSEHKDVKSLTQTQNNIIIQNQSVKINEEQRRDHQWEFSLSKTQFIPSDENFYRINNYSVKPGFGLFQALRKAKYGFSQLKINLPESLMVDEQDVYLFYTNQFGTVKKISNSSWSDFKEKCHDEHSKFSNKFKNYALEKSREKKFQQGLAKLEISDKLDILKNEDCPIIIQRGIGQYDWKTSQSIIQAKAFLEKKSTEANIDCFEQRFIFSRQMKACITRIVFFTKNKKNNKSNYAFLIQNYKEIFDKTKISINLKACLNSLNKDSFNIQKINVSSLNEHERQAQNIVIFLEKNYQIRISKIVLDFIEDIEGKIWLISMKSLEAENTISIREILSKTSSAEGDNSQNKLSKLSCSVYCKLCGALFKKEDVSKLLTNRLLYELIQHLKMRNITFKNIQVSNSPSPCRVCNLCYMVIVGEQELIKVEKKFARSQIMPIFNNEIISPLKLIPEFQAKFMNQWRLILYFCDIRNVKEIPSNVNFNDLCLQYQFHNQTYIFQIPAMEDFNSNISQTQMEIPLLEQKVHYFFSEDQNIQNFLNNTQIEVRLTQGKIWESYLALGNSKTISHFLNKEIKGQCHSSQILLFFANGNCIDLNIKAGLVCDGKFSTETLNLKEFHSIFLPEESYYNSNHFPDEWMEMYDSQYMVNKKSMKQISEGLKYELQITQSEFDQMIK